MCQVEKDVERRQAVDRCQDAGNGYQPPNYELSQTTNTAQQSMLFRVFAIILSLYLCNQNNLKEETKRGQNKEDSGTILSVDVAFSLVVVPGWYVVVKILKRVEFMKVYSPIASYARKRMKEGSMVFLSILFFFFFFVFPTSDG
jgi:hypothetical protein